MASSASYSPSSPQTRLTRTNSVATARTNASTASTSRRQLSYWVNMMNVVVAVQPQGAPLSPHASSTVAASSNNSGSGSSSRNVSSRSSIRSPGPASPSPFDHQIDPVDYFSTSISRAASSKRFSNPAPPITRTKPRRSIARSQDITNKFTLSRFFGGPQAPSQLLAVPEASTAPHSTENLPATGALRHVSSMDSVSVTALPSMKPHISAPTPIDPNSLYQEHSASGAEASLVRSDLITATTPPPPIIPSVDTLDGRIVRAFEFDEIPNFSVRTPGRTVSGRYRFASPPVMGPRPVHPLEKEDMAATAPPQAAIASTPTEQQVPKLVTDTASGESSRTSKSSFDIQTPDDIASKSPIHIKKSSTDSAIIIDHPNLAKPLPAPPPLRPRDPRRLSTMIADNTIPTVSLKRSNGISSRSFRRRHNDATSENNANDLLSIDIREDPERALQAMELHLDSPTSPAFTRPTKKSYKAPITADAAAIVIRSILEHVDDLNDLFSAARINKGFFSVYKKHELRLMKNALLHMSPAAWELRESSPGEIIAALESPPSEYTPTRYIQFHTRDTCVLSLIKRLILSRCQSVLSPATIAALQGTNAPRLTLIDDALWRIWTFCTLFGSNKGRELDHDAQRDWLRGGPACRSQSLGSTPFNRASFGRSNDGGLTADELDTLSEMWSSFEVLLSSLAAPHNIPDARAAGIFSRLRLPESDTAAHAAALREWVSYVLTLGPSVVYDLALHAAQPGATPFLVARDMRWTRWRRHPSGSRSGFLSVALAAAQADARREVHAPQEAQRVSAERRRSRGSRLAAELGTLDEQPPRAATNDALANWAEWVRSEAAIPSNPYADPGEPPMRALPEPPAHAARSTTAKLSLFPPEYRRPSTASVASGAAVESRRPSATSIYADSRRPSVTATAGIRKVASNSSFTSAYSAASRGSQIPRRVRASSSSYAASHRDAVRALVSS